MARGTAAHHESDAIPVVEFVKVDNEDENKLMGVSDKNARTYGYNDLSAFVRPEHYIRHIEPLEADLARQVEYDMDEQDQEFLDALNAERKREHLDRASYELFEIVMDRLEKEWFDLTKNIPKPDFALPSEDSTCAVCDDSEGENTNAIVFCDGCNLAVHQECYGVPYIPEGQWLCRKCTVSPENPVSCVLCPNEGGAFKQTVNGDWIHLLCAMWIPETQVVNETVMEPITNLERVNKQRFKLKCVICENRTGACIQCNKPSCFTAFHPTCARKEKLMMPMKGPQGTPAPPLIAYCERHLPPDQAAAREASLEAENEEEDEDEDGDARTKSKSARAYAKTYKPPIPLVPAIVVDRVLAYTGKIQIRKKPEFVSLICRYWSLKREARRGAPLLKRLHLEPWTASNAGQAQTEEERVAKLQQLLAVKADLEKVREMAALTCKRESRKLHQANSLRELLTAALFYNETALRAAFEKVTSHDRQGFFRFPVTKRDAPDYFDVVSTPMSWSVIEEKLNRHEYWDVVSFKADVTLVLSNALLYNKSATPFYKAATRIKSHMDSIWQELEIALGRRSDTPIEVKDALQSNARDDIDEAKGDIKPSLPHDVGDLEPAIWALSLLGSRDAVQPVSDYVINEDPLATMFSYEIGELVPPPPREPTPTSPTPPRRPTPPSRAPSKKGKKAAKAAKAEAERDARRRRQRAEENEAMERRLTEEAEKQAEWEEEKEREAVERRSRSAASMPRALQTTPGGQSESGAHKVAGVIHPMDATPRTRRASVQEATFLNEAMGTQTPGAGPSTRESPARPISSERSRKRRRTMTPTEEVVPFKWPSLPAVKEDVGKKDMFTFFNVGWTLPPGTKRGNRRAIERPQPPPPPPPPKKRAKLSHAKSALSVVSTSASDNQTLPGGRSEKKKARPGRGRGPRSRRGRRSSPDEATESEAEEHQPESSRMERQESQGQPTEEGDRPTAEPSSPLEGRDEDDEERGVQELAPSSEPATHHGESEPEEEEEDLQQSAHSVAGPSSPQHSRRTPDLPLSSERAHSPFPSLPPVPPPTEQVPQAPSPPAWPASSYPKATTSKWAAAQDPGWAATAGAYSGRSRSQPTPPEPSASQYSFGTREQVHTRRGDQQQAEARDQRAGWDATSAAYATRATGYSTYSQQVSSPPQAAPSYWGTAQGGYVSYPPSTHAEYSATRTQSRQYDNGDSGYTTHPSQYQSHRVAGSSNYDGSWPSSPQDNASRRPFIYPSGPTQNLERLVAAASQSAPASTELHAGGALELLAALAPSPQAPFSAPSPQVFAASSPQATQELPPFTRTPERPRPAHESTTPQQLQAPGQYWSPQPVQVPGVPYSVSHAQWGSAEPTPMSSPASRTSVTQWGPQEAHVNEQWANPLPAPMESQYNPPVEAQYAQNATPAPQYRQPMRAEAQCTPPQARPQFVQHPSASHQQSQPSSFEAQYSQQVSVEVLQLSPSGAQYAQPPVADPQYAVAGAQYPTSQVSAPQYGPPNIGDWQARPNSTPATVEQIQLSYSGGSDSVVPTAVEALLVAPSATVAEEAALMPTAGLPPNAGGTETPSQPKPANATIAHVANGPQTASKAFLPPTVSLSSEQQVQLSDAPTMDEHISPDTTQSQFSGKGNFSGLPNLSPPSPSADAELVPPAEPEDETHLGEAPQEQPLIECTSGNPVAHSDRPAKPTHAVDHEFTASLLDEESGGLPDQPGEASLYVQKEHGQSHLKALERPTPRPPPPAPGVADGHAPEASAPDCLPEVPPVTPPEVSKPPATEEQPGTKSEELASDASRLGGSTADPHEEAASTQPTSDGGRRRRGRPSRADMLARAPPKGNSPSNSLSRSPEAFVSRRISAARRQSAASPAHINERAALRAIASASAQPEADFLAPGVRAAAEGAYDPLLPSRVRVEDDGVPVLEELDTPATRRARALRRTAERRKMLAETRASEGAKEEQETQEAGLSTSASAPVPRARGALRKVRGRRSITAPRQAKGKEKAAAPSTLADEAVKAEEGDSELSSLSGTDDERVPPEPAGNAADSEALDEDAEGEPDEEEAGGEAEGEQKPKGGGGRRQRILHPKAGQNLLNEQGFIDCGTLVWAKISSYPWWPSVVYENDQTDQIPRLVIASYKRRSKMYPNNKYFIVQFFDKKRSWQVIQAKQMITLGDDPALDKEMLEEQEFKPQRLRSELDVAYREAMDQMESDLEEGNES